MRTDHCISVLDFVGGKRITNTMLVELVDVLQYLSKNDHRYYIKFEIENGKYSDLG